jgi:uncharacterized protein YyaL (SSP411 family)
MTHSANRLSDATSPYLLQHADNPVDWFEWGPEAFAEAEQRDVPVLLSVGYASCHWCHVMAHESFEDPGTAAIMNRLFVNVKVDREERPDVDRIYMDAVQAMTGRGGWPMTVFLTPDGRPFHAGTYYPSTPHAGHPSFQLVMEAIDEAWRTRRADIETQAGRLTQAVSTAVPVTDTAPDRTAIALGIEQAAGAFDERHGGFGSAPKFPQAPVLEFLLRSAADSELASNMLRGALTGMARGGIHDILGGGFSRYTIDDRWLIPHFEKMLYDNAQLARIYALASRAFDAPELATVARSTFTYMERDLSLPGGGFASGEDADSEGVEGKFYVFSYDEIRSVTTDDAVAAVLGVTPAGNFEGKTILHRSRPVAEVASERGRTAADLEAALDDALRGLGLVREQRVRPALDDKAVAAWNGLAIRAFADAGRWLDEPGLVETAARTARFVLHEMIDTDGRLRRSWRDGRTSGPAFCDDYGSVAVGLFSLFAATGDPEWYLHAERITRDMVDLFWDDADGGFFAVGSDAEQLITRPKNLLDNPTPSDNAIAAEALQHLAAYSGDGDIRARFDRTLQVIGAVAERAPLGVGHGLAVLTTHVAPAREVAIVGDPDARRPLLDAMHAHFRPHVFLAVGAGTDETAIPLLSGRGPSDGALAYVCQDLACEAPTASTVDLERSLN